MPRLTQSEIHSDFSSESGTWTGYRAEVTGFYADYPNSELDAHISREYNRKISNLGQDDSLYLHPYDAGFGYRGDGYNFFDILGNAAAAYSLRSIDPTKDPNVVKVRRSTDNSTKDFKASEVKDGTLEAFCSEQRELENNLENWNNTQSVTSPTTIVATSITGPQLSIKVGTTVRVQMSGTTSGGSWDLYTWQGSSNQHLADLGSSFNVDVTFTATSPMLYIRQGDAAGGSLELTSLTITLINENGYVTTWFDQGTNGNNATQTTSSAQPKIVDSGTLVTEGGKAALSFDGAGDFVSLNHDGVNGQSRLDSFYVTSTSDNNYLYPVGNGYGPVAVSGSTATALTLNYGNPTFYVNNQLQSWSTRGDVYTALNGYKLASHIGADTSTWSSIHEAKFGIYGGGGGALDYQGKLQEMIFFNTDQSANRVQMENSIMNYYNIS